MGRGEDSQGSGERRGEAGCAESRGGVWGEDRQGVGRGEAGFEERRGGCESGGGV